MPPVNMVCSKRLIDYTLNELNLEVEEIPIMGRLCFELNKDGIQIELSDMADQLICNLGTKTRFSWEMLFKIQDGPPANIINQKDFDMIMSELGV